MAEVPGFLSSAPLSQHKALSRSQSLALLQVAKSIFRKKQLSIIVRWLVFTGFYVCMDLLILNKHVGHY